MLYTYIIPSSTVIVVPDTEGINTIPVSLWFVCSLLGGNCFHASQSQPASQPASAPSFFPHCRRCTVHTNFLLPPTKCPPTAIHSQSPPPDSTGRSPHFNLVGTVGCWLETRNSINSSSNNVPHPHSYLFDSIIITAKVKTLAYTLTHTQLTPEQPRKSAAPQRQARYLILGPRNSPTPSFPRIQGSRCPGNLTPPPTTHHYQRLTRISSMQK